MIPTRMIFPHRRIFGSRESSQEGAVVATGGESAIPAGGRETVVAGADFPAPFLECFALMSFAS